MMADAGFRSLVVPLHADHVAAIRPTLLLMQAGALFLLLIGAVNLVNLLLIRASGRVKELAVRQAIGASRRHVVSEVLVETTLLTLTGGLLGLAVGAGGIRLLAVLGAERLPLGAHIAFDARLALVALAGADRHGHRDRRADRLVQPARPSGERAAIRVARRHGRPRGAASAARLHRRPDRAGVRAAGGSRPARAQPEARSMAVSPGFRPEHMS